MNDGAGLGCFSSIFITLLVILIYVLLPFAFMLLNFLAEILPFVIVGLFLLIFIIEKLKRK